MVEFGRYYINFIREFFENVGAFFRGLFEVFVGFFVNDIGQMFSNFIISSIHFTLLDWVMTLIVFAINIVFIVFLTMKVAQALKKYIKFRKEEIEKDELVAEIAFLNQKTMELIDEKNKILALKVSNLGINPNGDDEDIELTEEEIATSRFVKLLQVDKKYEDTITQIHMNENDMITLNELVVRFINFSANKLGLYYDRKIISAFFSGMAASKTMILEGISGT
ncbi:MAG: hypothetical protein RG740_03320, partial [Acholeplasmataceae bacterium]|nr:hypothetical protein [Acholeplasmataceae bacterium]